MLFPAKTLESGSLSSGYLDIALTAVHYSRLGLGLPKLARALNMPGIDDTRSNTLI